ncbi:unnamed protein product, partial [Amoebophrya sp. A25]|eukprot:GSA25T00023951001.1
MQASGDDVVACSTLKGASLIDEEAHLPACGKESVKPTSRAGKTHAPSVDAAYRANSQPNESARPQSTKGTGQKLEETEILQCRGNPRAPHAFATSDDRALSAFGTDKGIDDVVQKSTQLHGVFSK